MEACFDFPLLFVIVLCMKEKVEMWKVGVIIDKVDRFHLIQELDTDWEMQV